MSYTVRFGTYNIGQGYFDYSQMLQNKQCEYKKLADEMKKVVETIEKRYSDHARKVPNTQEKIRTDAQNRLIENIEVSVAGRLAEKCDVIALQEVANFNRPFMQTLKNKGFKVYRYENSNQRFSTALAIRESMFDCQISQNISIPSKSVKNGPIYGQEIAALNTKIKNSNIDMTFSSIHSWGFKLFSPEKERGEYSPSDVKQIKYGLEYTKEAFNNVRGKRFVIIGGDMNNNPQNQSEQFDFIKNQGFDVLEPNEITNINCYDPNYMYRKIDFIYVQKLSLIQRIRSAVTSFFLSNTSLTYSPAKVLDGFDYTMEGNCSDHKPVVTTLTITTTPSIISRIYHFLLGFVF